MSLRADTRCCGALMSLLPVNEANLPDVATLGAALDRLAPDAPVVILLHGYRFSPSTPPHDPHRHILSDTPDPGCWKAISWPRHLGLTGDQGLAIGFGWEARGTIWAAHRQAALAGDQLARLIATLRAIDPARPVHIFGHSLGARVAFAALHRLPRHAVQRVILLAAAVFRGEAAAALATPAGQTAQVFNVLGRENGVFDLLLCAALPHLGLTVGRGVMTASNWLDLPLDHGPSLSRLAGLGYPIPAPAARICHWSGYLRPGVWRLYRALLLTPGLTPLPFLRAELAPPPAQPRFAFLHLPFGQHRPS